ncbi:MAG: ABC transporter ATP-binding protein [Acidobacteriota bacterium]
MSRGEAAADRAGTERKGFGKLLASYPLIFGYLGRYRSSLLLGTVCLLITNQLTGVIPWLIKVAVDRIGGRTEPVWPLVLWILATSLLMAGIRTQSRLSILGVSRRIAYDMRRDVFQHLLAVTPRGFDKVSTGDIMSRLTNDLMLVRGLAGPGYMYLANTIMAYATSLAFMLALDPYLTLLSLVPFPFFFAAVWRLARRLHERQREAQERLAELSARVQEDLNGIWVVKAHAREEFAVEAYEVHNRAYTDANMKLVHLRSFLVPIMGMVGGVGALLVLSLGGLAVIRGHISLGGFVAFTGYLAMIASPTVQMGWVITLFQRARVALVRVDQLLRLPVEEEISGGASLGDAPARALEVKHLTFRYPASERPILDDVSFEVPAGATIGIFGPTGSGKTTLLKLLCRLEEPPPGTIFLDGVDVTGLPRETVRRCLGYVPQDPFLFRASIKENISFATDGASEDGMPAIVAAATAASIDEEIAGFPERYDTLLGERGITLSGGQRARVTLARALYERRPMLVLDDPFASVDVSTEHAIIGNLYERARGVTTIVVTHRVKALANTRRILVLAGGRLVDAGTHEELLERPGPYLDAFEEQRLTEELTAL